MVKMLVFCGLVQLFILSYEYCEKLTLPAEASYDWDSKPDSYDCEARILTLSHPATPLKWFHYAIFLSSHFLSYRKLMV